jgi:hypothetical protein
MISMNCSPPRAIEASRVALIPAAKARILIRCRSNMGAATCSSTKQNTPSMATPPIMPLSTSGLVQPIECPP